VSTFATSTALDQIDAVLAKVNGLQPQQYSDLSDQSDRVLEVQTLALALLERLVSRSSAYREQAEKVVSSYRNRDAIDQLSGILQALRFDVENGYVSSLAELVHASVFADFLEMAQHLLEARYKDAAAVIAGSTLEEHLRKLSDKSAVPVTDGSDKPRKADSLNADLYKAGAYNALMQKSVTAWLGLRNDAAHGHYDRYDARQVDALIRDVRDFMLRFPA
jgi:hypothetical protein